MKALRRRKLLCSAASFGIVCCAATPLAWADPNLPVSVPGTAAAAPAPLEEIIVTAERRKELLKKTPISMTVVQGRALDQSTLTGLSEILNTVPGVAATVDAQSGGTQLTIRGVSAAGPVFEGAGTVAYYLDGIPFGFVRSAVGPDLDPYDLNRVEILRGPQGTLYGAGGLNGVVRVLTNDPDLSEFDAKARSFFSGTERGGANYGGDLEFNVPLVMDKLAIRVVLGDNYYSGWINSIDKKNVNDADLTNYRVKVAAKPTEDLTAEFTFWRTDNTYGAPSAGDSGYFNDALLPEHMSSMYDGYGLKLGYDASAFTVTSDTSYLDYASTGFTDLNPEGLPGFEGVTDLRSKVFSEEVDLSSSGTGTFKWNAGAFYRDATDKVFQPLDTPGGQLMFDNYSDESKSWAVYGEIGQKFADDKLEVTLGLRYFNDNGVDQALSASDLGPVSLSPFKADFHALTPRAVLQWYPNPEQSFYLSYSQGFRSGVIQDEEVTVISPNVPPARPDSLNNYEVGWKGSLLDRRVDVEAAVFYIDWNHVQQVVQTLISSGVYAGAVINGASASGAGAEGSISARVTDRLRLSANLSWNGLAQDDAVYSAGVLLFSKGQRLNYSPAYTGSSSAEYSFDVGSTGFRGRLSSSFTYTSSMLDTTLPGPSRVVLAGNNIYSFNARLAVDSPNRKWTASLFANNITNDNGSPIKSASTDYFDFRVRPTTIGMQLDYRY